MRILKLVPLANKFISFNFNRTFEIIFFDLNLYVNLIDREYWVFSIKVSYHNLRE